LKLNTESTTNTFPVLWFQVSAPKVSSGRRKGKKEFILFSTHNKFAPIVFAHLQTFLFLSQFDKLPQHITINTKIHGIDIESDSPNLEVFKF
jgi:DNA phosphorothioation-dependent restriction protein DptG